MTKLYTYYLNITVAKIIATVAKTPDENAR